MFHCDEKIEDVKQFVRENLNNDRVFKLTCVGVDETTLDRDTALLKKIFFYHKNNVRIVFNENTDKDTRPAHSSKRKIEPDSSTNAAKNKKSHIATPK